MSKEDKQEDKQENDEQVEIKREFNGHIKYIEFRDGEVETKETMFGDFDSEDSKKVFDDIFDKVDTVFDEVFETLEEIEEIEFESEGEDNEPN